MALSKNDIVKKKIRGLKTERGNEIFRLYFLNEMSQEDIRDKLNARKRARDLGVLYNLVSNYTTAWKELGYLTKKKVDNPKSKSKYHPHKYVFYATIKPFFEYSKNILSHLSTEEKIKMDHAFILNSMKGEFKLKRLKLTKKEMEAYQEVAFTDIEKEILDYIFSFKEVREIIIKDEDLFRGIIHFLERIFFYETENDWPHRINHFFRKWFFTKNKRYLKVTKEIYFSRLKEIKEFERISHGSFNKLSTKIKLISNFNDEDYFNLTVNTELRKYQYMPSLREIMKEKDQIKRHMLVRNWSKLYFFDEIPDGFK